jgi:hypothetical protein
MAPSEGNVGWKGNAPVRIELVSPVPTRLIDAYLRVDQGEPDA